MDLEEPNILAKLPKPAQVYGDVKFGPVWARRNAVEKKRLEICAAVDGNSVSIYDIQTGKILGSHPVAPESVFIGPPCSLFWKTAEGCRRMTYCALKRHKLRIHCFEAAEKDGRPSVSESSFELTDVESPVVLLQVHGATQMASILVLQQNGILTNLSHDMSEVLAVETLPQDPHTSSRILSAHLLSSVEAEKSVLKSRADIITSANGSPYYLATICESQDTSINSSAAAPEYWYKIYCLSPLEGDAVVQVQPIQCVVQHQLHNISLRAGEPPWSRQPFLFESRATRLYVKQAQAIVKYDLTTVVPKRTAVLPNRFNGYIDICPISSSLILSSFPDSLKLCDMHYDTIQARMDLNRTSLKRKRTRTGEDPRSGRIELIGYFPRLSRCLARRKNHILAIDIKTTTAAEIVCHTNQKPLLINSIGRGSQSEDLKQVYSRTKKSTSIGQANNTLGISAEWHETRKQLDLLVENGDIVGLEQTFLQATDGLVKAVSEKAERVQAKRYPNNYFSTAKIDYILSKLFKIDSESIENIDASTQSQCGLRLCFSARDILIWLGRMGALTKHRLFKVLAPQIDSTEVANDFETCSIVQALMSGDESLQLLQDFLQNSPEPDMDEQALAVKILVDRAINDAANLSSSISGATGTEADTDQPLTTTNFETTMTAFDAKASGQSDLPTLALAISLGLALKRFASNPPQAISLAIKKHFSGGDVLGLIQFLRQQLFLGGATRFTLSQDYLSWTEAMKYGHLSEDGKYHFTRHLDLDIIVKVLSSCVDAVGPQGLLGSGGDDDNFAASIVTDLQSEVNRTLLGLEDALELRGFLRETLRYVESVPKPFQPNREESQRQIPNIPTSEPGTVATLFAETSAYGYHNRSSTAMPLSLRSDHVNPLKVHTGGQVSRRSLRNTYLLESRLKGPYAFERLII